MEDLLIAELEIPLYIRQYEKSKSVRPKYYKRGKKTVPDKYRNKEHGWKEFSVIQDGKKVKEQHLINIASQERIVFNSYYVGKPNVVNINGQDIYSGVASPHDRNKMMGAIKDEFKRHLKNLPPITRFPIRIHVYLFDTIIDDEFSNGQDWDVDNRFFPYGKSFADTLTYLGKIPDDNRYYITESPHAIFVPVPDVEDRKLVIHIMKDNRPVIMKNYLYQQKHGKNLL